MLKSTFYYQCGKLIGLFHFRSIPFRKSLYNLGCVTDLASMTLTGLDGLEGLMIFNGLFLCHFLEGARRTFLRSNFVNYGLRSVSAEREYIKKSISYIDITHINNSNTRFYWIVWLHIGLGSTLNKVIFSWKSDT